MQWAAGQQGSTAQTGTQCKHVGKGASNKGNKQTTPTLIMINQQDVTKNTQLLSYLLSYVENNDITTARGMKFQINVKYQKY